MELWARTMFDCSSILWLQLTPKRSMCIILHYFATIRMTNCLWGLLCLPPPFQNNSSFKIRSLSRGNLLNHFQFKSMDFVVTNQVMTRQLWTTILKIRSLLRLHSICHHLLRGIMLKSFFDSKVWNHLNKSSYEWATMNNNIGKRFKKLPTTSYFVQ